jgi:hypothetical protein
LSVPYEASGIVVENVQGAVEISGFSITAPLGANNGYGVRLVGTAGMSTIDSCSISAPTGPTSSVGIDATLSSVTVTNSTVQTNSAFSSFALRATSAGSAVVTNSTLAAGPAVTNSAGIFATNTPVTVTGSAVSATSASNAIGVWFDGAALQIHGSTVNGGAGGSTCHGLRATNTPSVDILSSTINGGTVVGAGIGITFYGAQIAKGVVGISGSTINGPAGNTKHRALEVGASGASLTIDRSTIMDAFGTDLRGLSLLGNGTTAMITNSTIGTGSGSPAYGVELGANQTVTIDHCVLTANQNTGIAPANDTRGLSVGTSGLGLTNVTVTHSRISSGGANLTGGSAGAYLFTPGCTLANNVIYNVGTSGVGLSVGVYAGNGHTLTNNIIGVGMGVGAPGAGSQAVDIANTGVAATDNILFTDPTPAANACFSSSSNTYAVAPLQGSVVVDCPVGYFDNGVASFNAICSGNFGVAGCGTVLAPAATGTTGGTAGSVFAPSFNPTDFTTWIIEASGPADRDQSGGWTTGDAGTLFSDTGPLP